MNPTDQARKEARKKELKKNKKQRQLVRAAVLKGKDPSQIIEEMEKIDQMEYNVTQPPPLNEKVLKDKRKKLKETLDRVLKMYVKDDQEKWSELKEQLIQYERRRTDLLSYFEAVRHAQQVQVDEIPLPSAVNSISRIYPGSLTSQIPLPDLPQSSSHLYSAHPHLVMTNHHPLMNIPIPPSILKKTSAYAVTSAISTLAPNKEPPGVPPYPPVDLDSEDEESPADKIKETANQKSRTIRFADDKSNKLKQVIEKETEKERDLVKVKPTSLQQKMLVMAGQDIDQFMREMEVVHKKRETERAQDLNVRLSLLESDYEGESEKLNNEGTGSGNTDDDKEACDTTTDYTSKMNHSAISQQQNAMPLMGLPPQLFRPPPPPMHLRMPPPPPPRLRLPPGPPPGIPRMLRPGPPAMPRMPPPQMQIPNLTGVTNSQLQQQTNTLAAQSKTPNVLSAAPQLINRKDKDGRTSSTIEAKPQIRNLAADVTRFLPTSLRVKRDDKKKTNTVLRLSEKIIDVPMTKAVQPKTKDDAYMQFMQEMKGLL